jgi:hypothetical protein
LINGSHGCELGRADFSTCIEQILSRGPRLAGLTNKVGRSAGNVDKFVRIRKMSQQQLGTGMLGLCGAAVFRLDIEF